MVTHRPDEIAKFYAGTSGVQVASQTTDDCGQDTVETRPDGDRDTDHRGILAHATKVAAGSSSSPNKQYR